MTADERYCPSHGKGLPSHGLFLTVRGEGHIYLHEGGRPITLSGGSCFPLRRGIPCRYAKTGDSGEWSFYFLEFRFPPVMDEGAFPWEELRPMDRAWGTICERLIDEAAWNRPGRNGILEMGLLEILTGIIREGESAPRGLDSVLSWMHSHPDLGCSPGEMIRLSGMGRTRFFREFRERTGRSPQVYFRSLKVGAVKSLLQTTDLSLAEIACRLGFCDEYYLSRCFKQETGKSPRAWQRTGGGGVGKNLFDGKNPPHG